MVCKLYLNKALKKRERERKEKKVSALMPDAAAHPASHLLLGLGPVWLGHSPCKVLGYTPELSLLIRSLDSNRTSWSGSWSQHSLVFLTMIPFRYLVVPSKRACPNETKDSDCTLRVNREFLKS